MAGRQSQPCWQGFLRHEMDGEWPYDVIGSLPAQKSDLSILVGQHYLTRCGGEAEYHHIIKPWDAGMNDGER
jgi:hypothetical protein